MHRSTSGLVFTALALVLGSLACKPKISEEAKAAAEAATAADTRVKALEQELAEARKAKGEGDHQTVTASQEKALEKLVQDAKKRAEQKHQKAEQLAKAPAPAAAPVKAPVIVEVPAGTQLAVKLAKELNTETAKAGDGWSGTLAAPVVVGERTIWPEGTEVRGVITQSTPAGRLASGQGGLGIRLTEVGTADVDAGTHLVTGGLKGERNTKFIAGGAAIGALVGILSDRRNKNDHALGGAAIGAAAGTAIAAGTADTIIRIPAAKAIAFSLKAAEKVTLKP